MTDHVDLTDLVNPAFLANKRVVESLILTKYPSQAKYIRLGYQYKDQSQVGFKTLLDHVELFREQQFTQYQ